MRYISRVMTFDEWIVTDVTALAVADSKQSATAQQ
jgi:hypothetical protein